MFSILILETISEIRFLLSNAMNDFKTFDQNKSVIDSDKHDGKKYIRMS